MADIRITCPHCRQHITCDELWAGHELQCPSCQGSLTVPGIAPTVAAEPPPDSLAPQPPAGGARLSISHSQGRQAEAAAAAQQRVIPIRNLAPPPPPKSNRIIKSLKIAAVVAVLGVGGYFGFVWLRGQQQKANAKSNAEAKNSDGGQVGHIANLYNALDATEPGHFPGDRRARGAVAAANAASPGQGNDAASPAAPENTAPSAPIVWTLDLAAAKIPQNRVGGTISGSNFVAETVRIDQVGAAQVLRLTQGQIMSPDREVLIYLHLRPGEKIGGQNLSITQDTKSGAVSEVAKRWKTNPLYAPSIKPFYSGYAMKLDLGEFTNDIVPGKIYLALPDSEQTVVAGTFKAATSLAGGVVQAGPVATPTAPAAAPMSRYGNSALDARYGIRR